MNRLAHETSPYLLQHAHNPVDWYAWKPEALDRARNENKLLLVSIGYSTCHWCHVMERESFENEDIAAFMNENFVCIKVDREERPDIDAIYMEACQILTGSGGWPLNVFLLPDTRPFYAGTYYPPRPMHQRPSWLQVLQHLSNIWEQTPEKVHEQADRLMQQIQRSDDVFTRTNAAKAPDPTLGMLTGDQKMRWDLEATFYKLREGFDRTEGGFGGAPKFPGTMSLRFLLDYYHYTQQEEALDHVVLSLRRMISGGIYDQLGGGFARYATDREWLVPHFEKMLYDNALLVGVLADACRVLSPLGAAYDADRILMEEAVVETLSYIEREMTSENGGFYSAQDADSEGVEGKFFVWDKSEIDQVLGSESDLFCAFYGVTEHGNWEEKNILWRVEAIELFAAKIKMSVMALKARLHTCREKLFAVRSKRIWPGLDSKIIISWNALMTSAYCSAYAAFGRDSDLEAAERNMVFLLTHCFDDPQRLHVWNTKHPAFLEDYAYLIAALLDLYEATFNTTYLDRASALTDEAIALFADTATGLFFFTAAGQSDIIFRKKDLYDNATPSGNSTMLHNLQRLSLLLDRDDWRTIAQQMLETMRNSAGQFPQAFARWTSAWLYDLFPYKEIVVVGDNAFDKARQIRRLFLPNKVLCAATTTEKSTLPLLAGKDGDTDALIYVCEHYACQRPVRSVADLF